MACALAKVQQTDKALSVLADAIKLNPEYAKAFFKRGDIFLSLLKYDEAIGEYSKVKEFAPQTPGLREKLEKAKLELKKSKRKDYYKMLNLVTASGEADTGVGEADIKKAYKRAAMKWHPDKHQ